MDEEESVEEDTRGILVHLEYVWQNDTFSHSEIRIQGPTQRGLQEFYGMVPESFLGEKVVLYQNQKEEGLFQRLTRLYGNGPTYQVRAHSREGSK